LPKGTRIEVVKVEGLILQVKAVEKK
jgi:membrane protein implicated in regulation of membrane protease activity